MQSSEQEFKSLLKLTNLTEGEKGGGRKERRCVDPIFIYNEVVCTN